MDQGTSPSVAGLPTGAGWVVAFQSNADDLYIYTSAGTKTNTRLAMRPGTDPSIAVQPDGAWEVAYESTTNLLETYSSTGASHATSDTMAAGTSPSIIPEPDGSYEAAFAADNKDLDIFHTGGTTNGTTLGMDAGTSPALAVPAPSSSGDCAAANNCTPQTFADAILAYPGVNGVITASNEYALETWERAEGGGAGCPGQPANTTPWTYSAGPAGNPMNTERLEPGSTDWNTAGVQIYANADGETCWYWGIQTTSATLLNGAYANILSILDNPVADDTTQCDDLADADGASPRGTGNFGADC